jgi:hypothetical protein
MFASDASECLGRHVTVLTDTTVTVNVPSAPVRILRKEGSIHWLEDTVQRGETYTGPLLGGDTDTGRRD